MNAPPPPSPPPLRVLVVEDLETDAILTVRELTRAGFKVDWQRVDTEPAMVDALAAERWDLVLADYSMPSFSAPRAYSLVKQRGLDVPFIIVSGTMGEEAAVEAMRAGAADYLLKGRLARLAPVVERELREASIRAAERRMRDQLVIAERMASVGTLAAGIAHEINNPLAALVANLDFLQLDFDGLTGEVEAGADRATLRRRVADMEEPLRHAQQCADRVRTIVRDLRVFSHPGDEAPVAVDVSRVLESTVRMAWSELKTKARLAKDIGGVTPVLGTEARIAQVFLNLVINACQAIPEGDPDAHELRLVTRQAGDRVLIEVRDTGIGIRPEHLARVFDPFFTTKPAGIGTGLGLAICHRIVQSMGGEITVRSEVGKGTVVSVLLPAALGVTTPASASAATTPGSTSSAPMYRVLIVDDEPMVGAAVRRMLQGEYEIITTTRARQALDWIGGGEAFDAVVCDVMMPEMSGMELYDEVLRTAPELARRMVFMTGGAFTPAAAEFFERVPSARIEKPFDARALSTLVRGAIK